MKSRCAQITKRCQWKRNILHGLRSHCTPCVWRTFNTQSLTCQHFSNFYSCNWSYVWVTCDTPGLEMSVTHVIHDVVVLFFILLLLFFASFFMFFFLFILSFCLCSHGLQRYSLDTADTDDQGKPLHSRAQTLVRESAFRILDSAMYFFRFRVVPPRDSHKPAHPYLTKRS